MNTQDQQILLGLSLLLLVGGCARTTQATTGATASACSVTPRDGAQPYTLAGAGSLAGTYGLQLVVTAGTPDGRTGPYRLTLWANDSARRNAYRRPAEIGRWPGERPLTGYLEGDELDSASVLRSRDPDRPGVTVIDSVLHLGLVDALDGGGDRLLIRTTSTEGFWGSWHRDRGIQLDPRSTRGHFCATRLE